LALSQYQEIIDHHNDGIYIDEALFFSAEIIKKLKETDKAKPLYEKIIFNHEDSIYFVEARKTSGNCGETLIYKRLTV
jgi:thymidine kinase